MAVAMQTAWAQNGTGLFDNWTETDYSDFEITHEFFMPGGIAKSGSGGYDMTGYIPVKEGDIIVFSGDRSPGIPFMMGYADNAGSGATVLLGDFDANNWDGLQVREREVPIPAGTTYVRCSARNTSLPNWASQNMSVIKRFQTEEKRTIRILAIGNSFSGDIVESWFSQMARTNGIELVIGNAVGGGYGLREHWQSIVDGKSETEYRKIGGGTYILTTGHTLTELISDEPWDIILFLQDSAHSGLYSSYTPYLQHLIDYVKGIRPQARLGWIMTWAYANGADHGGFNLYQRDQMTMFNAILDATTRVMQDHPDLKFMVPCGTAVQNLRSSFLGDRVNRDGVHLNLYFGRYVTATTLYATLFGEEAAIQDSYVPYCMNDLTMNVIRRSSLDAVRNPYAITPQPYADYDGDNLVIPADIRINFSSDHAIPSGWNNLGVNHNFLAGLKDANGNDPCIFIYADDEFTGAGTPGPTVTDTPLNMPAEVSNTALYGYSEGNFSGQNKKEKVVLQFHHLNKTLSYDFTFFSSRTNSADNRETQFTLAGKDTITDALDASSNFKTLTIPDVCPDKNGTVILTIQPGPNNNNPYKFYYLNALRISVHSTDPVPDWNRTDFSDYEITHEFFTPSGTARSSSGGYDMTGYIPVSKGDTIIFSGDRSPGIPFMIGYADRENNDATVLLGNFDPNDHTELKAREKEVIIPAGIAYVRCSARNTSLPNWASCNMTVIKRICLDFSLEGDDRPIIGNSLSIYYSGDLSKYNVKWTRGDALGMFDDTVLSSAKDYVITANDYEHWLRVSVCDNAGNTLFTKDTWISKLPVIYIDTEDGNPITSKTEYVTANIRIQGNADFEQQYMDKTGIRGRGSSSWKQYPQKPYKLKLDKKTKLFGFGKSKHWVLIPNFNDKSCLRNYTASRLAKQLGVIGMNMTWVDVVINGEVQGCYILSQHIRVDKNSVDIFDWEGEAEDVADALFDAIKEENALEDADKKQLEDVMEQNLSWVTDGQVSFKGKTYNFIDYRLKKEYDISKGYLFEASDKTNGQTRFVTPNQVNIEVGAPEYLKTNSEMMNFVTTFWKDFEAEYCRVPTVEGKNFGKYTDMKSMVGIWLVNEIMGQGDPVNSRFSFIANDGKLHFGPAWDFDHGSGSWSTGRNVNAFYTLIHDLEFTYYKKWFPDPFLCQMAYDVYWNVARPFIMDCVSEGGEIDAKYALIAEAAQTNDILWGDYPSMLNPSAKPRTSAEDVEILRTFLRGHINWLDEQFQSVKTLVEAMNKVCIYPCDPNIIDSIQHMASHKTYRRARKVIKDKHLYILKGDETYFIDGKRVKQ